MHGALRGFSSTSVPLIQISVKSNWLVHSYGMRESQNRGGFYEFQLVSANDQIKILQKKIILIDDKLVGPIDIFHI
jgi:3-phenylpropionate/cinnamic acid dioxygenase small subunit